MPMPKPKQDEPKREFFARCMGDETMREEYEDDEQRAAVCNAQWEKKSFSDNLELVKAVREREPNSSHGYGITTADHYVKSMAEAVGLDMAYRVAANRRTSFDDVLQKAARTLVYANRQMVLEKATSNASEFKGMIKGAPEGIEVPKNALIVFRHKLSTSAEDRDEDIVHPEGMKLDPKMLLLWQHIHTMPLGPYMYTVSQDDKSVRVVSAIVDMNATTHDAAVMVDNKMARFSHGFKATEFAKRVNQKGEETGGFEIFGSEVMEESLVSVPSNVGADTEDVLIGLVDKQKLTSPMMKEWAKSLKEKQPTKSPGISIQYREQLGDYARELSCGSFADLQKAVAHGVVGNGKGQENEGEDDDENKSATGEGSTRTEEEGTGTAGTSKQKDEGAGKGKEQREAGDSKGLKEQKGAYFELDGSWEDTICKLRGLIREMYPNQSDTFYVSIAATFPGRVVYCIERKIGDEPEYFSIGWTRENGTVKLEGQPEPVRVEIDFGAANSDADSKVVYGKSTKAGRVLSKANEAKIREARDDIKEASQMEGLTRACRALLNGAHNSLGTVLEAIGKEGESSVSETQIGSVKEAMTYVLMKGTSKDWQRMQECCKGLLDVEVRKQTTDEFRRKVIGSRRS